MFAIARGVTCSMEPIIFVISCRASFCTSRATGSPATPAEIILENMQWTKGIILLVVQYLSAEISFVATSKGRNIRN